MHTSWEAEAGESVCVPEHAGLHRKTLSHGGEGGTEDGSELEIWDRA